MQPVTKKKEGMKMFKSIKSKVMGFAALAAATAANAAPAWATGNASGDSVSSAFDEVMTYAAPIGIGVVVAVAGIRVVIKLINRGAGK